MNQNSPTVTMTPGGSPAADAGNQRFIDWTVIVIVVAAGCTAAWIGLVLWLMFWVTRVVLA